jgi:hypothetical protein
VLLVLQRVLQQSASSLQPCAPPGMQPQCASLAHWSEQQSASAKHGASSALQLALEHM